MTKTTVFLSKVTGEESFWKSEGKGTRDFCGNVDNLCIWNKRMREKIGIGLCLTLVPNDQNIALYIKFL